MIVDRYDPVNLFELMPKLRLEMEPELAALDRLLEDDEIFLQVSRPTRPSDARTPQGSDAAPRRWR